MDFNFTYPFHATGPVGARFLIAEIDVKVSIECDDPLLPEDWSIGMISVPDLGQPGDGWRPLSPKSDLYATLRKYVLDLKSDDISFAWGEWLAENKPAVLRSLLRDERRSAASGRRL